MNEKYEVIITTISNSAKKKKKLQPYQKKCTFLKQENVINWRKKKGKSQVRQKKFKRRKVRV